MAKPTSEKVNGKSPKPPKLSKPPTRTSEKTLKKSTNPDNVRQVMYRRMATLFNKAQKFAELTDVELCLFAITPAGRTKTLITPYTERVFFKDTDVQTAFRKVLAGTLLGEGKDDRTSTVKTLKRRDCGIVVDSRASEERMRGEMNDMHRELAEMRKLISDGVRPKRTGKNKRPFKRAKKGRIGTGGETTTGNELDTGMDSSSAIADTEN